MTKKTIGLMIITLALAQSSLAAPGTGLPRHTPIARPYLIVAQNDAVDLRGKAGVVDPSDLKRDNPPERSLHITEPPSPPTEKPSGGSPSSPPNGNLQGPNGGATLRYVPPRENGLRVP